MEEYEKKFLENYEIKILNDNRRRARYTRPRFFTDPTSADIVTSERVDIETERVFTLEIPESRLRTLMELEKRFYNYLDNGAERNMFDLIMEKLREETSLRKQYTTVQTAYEHYSNALHLVGYIRKI